MNLKQIESFVAVADTKGFSQAAGLLYLTQPTISAHISTLEKELNVKLFARTTKEVVLTANGEKLYDLATEMMELERKMTMLFASSDKEEANVLRIATSTVPAQYILPDLLNAFSKKYPNIQYSIKEMDSLNVIKEVNSKTVDIGFSGTQVDDTECRFIHLCKDDIVLVTPNREYYKNLIEDSSNIDWILSESVIARKEGSGTRREADRILLRQGVDPLKLRIIATFESTETIKKSVVNGMGIAFISRLAVENEIKEEKLLYAPLDKNDKGRNLNLVYNNHVILSKNAELFLQSAKNHFR